MTATTYSADERQALREIGRERTVTHLVDIEQLSFAISATDLPVVRRTVVRFHAGHLPVPVLSGCLKRPLPARWSFLLVLAPIPARKAGNAVRVRTGPCSMAVQPMSDHHPNGEI